MEMKGDFSIQGNKMASQDLCTATDVACQELIKSSLLNAFPCHDFLGEEDVGPPRSASTPALQGKLQNPQNDWLWVVDPMDGTTNFVHDVPLSCVSIAAAYKGSIQVGVIYDPHRDELFSASRGQGAFLNGKPIAPDGAECLRDSLLAFDPHFSAEAFPPMMRAATHFTPRVRTLRSLGSAALQLAWVGCGRLSVRTLFVYNGTHLLVSCRYAPFSFTMVHTCLSPS